MTDNTHMLLTMVRRTIARDIAAARRQVEAYPDDESIWKVVPGITNAGGTLALHMAGNIRHFIGAILGNTGYVRDRDAEFATRGASRAEIINQLDDAANAAQTTLSRFEISKLEDTYPLKINDMDVPTGAYLVHLAVHFGYHLGQMDYHRRIVTGNGATVNTMALAPVFAEEPMHA